MFAELQQIVKWPVKYSRALHDIPPKLLKAVIGPSEINQHKSAMAVDTALATYVFVRQSAILKVGPRNDSFRPFDAKVHLGGVRGVGVGWRCWAV